MASDRITVPSLQKMKRQGRRITMLTCYDATFARLLDPHVDALLVGDSLGMVIQGGSDTLAVTLDEVIYHTRAVARGVKHAHLVADMPFMSYQVSVEEGVRNAGRLLKEGGAHAVKIEGAETELVSRLTRVGIPVLGHLGLTPQSIHTLGGYKIQGRRREQARKLLDDAVALQEAGAYGLVLEAVPLEVAEQVSQRLEIPTIGIGAGPHCDGQVLVIYDLLGFDESFQPRFLKRFDSLGVRVEQAVESYAEEVRQGVFPGPEHSFSQAAKRPSQAPDEAKRPSRAPDEAKRPSQAPDEAKRPQAPDNGKPLSAKKTAEASEVLDPTEKLYSSASGD
ncbi:MAG: 3-methyl-2-oxobutanoate hydroxymethyltransferase [Deltaproteobacteria bacterium]|nr:3-methyl-2-oxobutanoate hydroxymethyltransferase [Deltaproteobacteria bacterium]